jgi:selenide,water dikinase
MPSETTSQKHSEKTVRLTEMAKAAGCAAKLSPSVLHEVLGKLSVQSDADVLVGFDTSDDAGIYRVSDELALVQTVDFFTPIVDNPFTFGQVAAANALSDVYAMGGKPLSALSIVGFPPAQDTAILERVMAGGLSKMEEAKCVLLGGHSIRDPELKFGYAVTGTVHPKKFWTNAGAKPGDLLVFTKSLGTGLIATALKAGAASEEAREAAERSMTKLNDVAAEALREIEKKKENAIHAVTDVTGFGLLGHARGIAMGSKVSLKIRYKELAVLPSALEYARRDFVSQGLKNNEEFVKGCAEFSDVVPAEYRKLCCDPQTSGGLLVALDRGARDVAMESFANHNVPARWIGEVVEKHSPLIWME